jgi:quinol monooxygenase YgiN
LTSILRFRSVARKRRTAPILPCQPGFPGLFSGSLNPEQRIIVVFARHQPLPEADWVNIMKNPAFCPDFRGGFSATSGYHCSTINKMFRRKPGMYVVIVDFTLKPGKADLFMPLMTENADRSLTDEEGCHQFDVCTDPDNPETVFLYELYTDRAAFDLHLAAPHFKAFDAAVAELVADKKVRTFERAFPAGGGAA